MKKFFALFLAMIMVFGLVSVPKATEAADEYSVTLQVTGPNDTVKTFNEDGKTPQKTFAAGETVVLEAWTGNKGYKAKPIEIWINGDKTRNYAKELKEKQNIEYFLTFEMPAVDITIEVVFEKWDAPADGYTLTVTQEGKGKYSVNPEKEYYALDEEVIISFTPEKGWTVEEVTVNGVPAAPGSGSEFKWAVQIKGDTEVHVKFVEEGISLGYNLNVVIKNDQVPEGCTATTNPVPGIVAPGTKVNVLVTKPNNYRAIVTVDPEPEWTDVAKYEFTMPNADTTVTVEFVEIQSSEKHNVYVKIKNPDCGNAYADPSKDVAMNEGVTLYFEPKLGYKAEYTIEPEGLKTDGNYTFMMPDQDVYVDVEFVKEGISLGYNLNVVIKNDQVPEGCTATTDPVPGIVAPGTKVNVIVRKPDTYRAIVTVDPEPEWTNEAKYEFTMPKADTTVTVEFVEIGAIPVHNVTLTVANGIGYVAYPGMTEMNKVQSLRDVPAGVRVTASWESGTKEPTSVKFNGVAIPADQIEVRSYSATRTTYYYYFTMPDDTDVLIEVVFDESNPDYDAWISGVEGWLGSGYRMRYTVRVRNTIENPTFEIRMGESGASNEVSNITAYWCSLNACWMRDGDPVQVEGKDYTEYYFLVKFFVRHLNTKALVSVKDGNGNTVNIRSFQSSANGIMGVVGTSAGHSMVDFLDIKCKMNGNNAAFGALRDEMVIYCQKALAVDGLS